MVPSPFPDENNRKGLSAHQRTLFKRRFLVFSPTDEAIFSEALHERYRAVEFVRRSSDEDLPGSLPQGSLLDVSGSYIEIIVTSDDQRSGQGYRQRFIYNRSVWDWACLPAMAYDPPTLNAGEIYASYEPESPDYRDRLRIISQIWKLIERLATNRYKSGHPLGNELSGGDFLLMKNAPAGIAWLGHGALEWCQKNPRRMLNGSWRACDDWRVPQNDWYRAMHRRALKKYCDDLEIRPARPGGQDEPDC